MNNKGNVFLYIISVIAIVLSIFALLKNNDNGDVDNKTIEANNIVLKEENSVIKWKYDSDSTWHELYDLSRLSGKNGIDGIDGKNGANGTNGKDGKNGTNGKDGRDGVDGINGKDGTNGLDGKDGINGVDGINGLNGKDGKDGKDGIDGTNGTDGREVELRAEGSIIQWRYVGDSSWTDLIDVSNIEPPVPPVTSIVESVNGDSDELVCYKKGTTCTEGDLFKVKVNDSTTLDFYVIDSDSTTVTLIAASNIGNENIITVAWNQVSPASTAAGPITLLNYLNTLTSTWTNIDNIANYTYTNSGTGYKKLQIVSGVATVTDANGDNTNIEGKSKARLLTYEEAYKLGCRTTTPCTYAWLYGNLDGVNNSLKPYGYWMLTTYNDSRAYNIRNTGVLGNNSAVDTTGRGIRPVITISKI